MKFNDIFRTGAVLVIVFIIGLFGLLFLVNFLSGKGTPDSAEEAKENIPESQQLEKKTIINNQGKEVEVYVVSEDRIPETNEARLEAPALALLPTHLPESYSPDPQNNELPSELVKSLNNTVIRFLESYETFNVERTVYAEANGKPDPYQESVKPFLSDYESNDILQREEMGDIEGVCPFATAKCVSNSTWLGGNTPEIIEYEDGTAYVTVTGVVQYSSTNTSDPLNGRTGYREYALILSYNGTDWKVDRVVAETGDQANL